MEPDKKKRKTQAITTTPSPPVTSIATPVVTSSSVPNNYNPTTSSTKNSTTQIGSSSPFQKQKLYQQQQQQQAFQSRQQLQQSTSIYQVHSNATLSHFQPQKQERKKKLLKSSELEYIDLVPEVVLNIFSFISFPLKLYLKQIFFPEQLSSHYYNNVINNNIIFQPSSFSYYYYSASSRGANLKRQKKEQQKLLYQHLYGVFTTCTLRLDIETVTKTANNQQEEKLNVDHGKTCFNSIDSANDTKCDPIDLSSDNVDGQDKKTIKDTSSVVSGDNNDVTQNSSNENKFSINPRRKRLLNRSQPYFLWQSIDLGISSYFYQDHEPLNVCHLQLICSLLKNCKYLNFCGHHQFNDLCLEILLKRNREINHLDLRNTKVDYSGIEDMMIKRPEIAQNLKVLKLTWLSRTQSNEQNSYIFGYNPSILEQQNQNTTGGANADTQQAKMKIGNAKNLVHLELINNSIHLQGLKVLIQYNLILKVLNLSHNPIRDDGAIALCQCKNLRELYLQDCDITDKGATQLLSGFQIPQANLPKDLIPLGIIMLDLSHNHAISDASLINIDKHPTLESLKLSDTNIGDVGAQYLKKNKMLKSLILDHTKLENDGLRHLLMKSVVVNDSSDAPANRSEGTSPAQEAENKQAATQEQETKYVRNMESLVYLNVRQTKVSKSIIFELKKQLDLKSLTLHCDYT